MSAARKKSSPKSSIAITAPEPQRWQPHAYQVRAIKWLLSHAGAGLFLDPGLGKTSIFLAGLKVLKKEGELQKGALIICPLRPLYNVWDPRNPESETRKWIDFHDLKIEVLHGDDKEATLRTKADAYLINPEGLDWLARKVSPDRFDVLVVDESTVFKHSNTQRFKILRSFLPYFRRRWIGTGTPSPNGLLDLFGQIYICDLGNALGRYITHYRRKYFLPTGYGGYTWVPQHDAEERIYAALKPLVLRLDEKDYLKLPKIYGSLVHSPRPSMIRTQLPPAARKKYEELEELFFMELDEGSITAANAGVKHMKLRQAANGGIYLDYSEHEQGSTRKWAHLHDAKTEAVVELLEGGLGGQAVMIAIEFHHDVDRLRRHKLLANVPCIGEGSPKDDAALARDWNSGKLRLAFANPASFSRGSNMQRGGDALIWHSMVWNLEHYDQMVRRFWRQGRKRPFYVHHIIAEGTHDELIAKALAGKNATQRALLDALRAAARARKR